ncbi:MAG: hypothetical protein IKE30_07295 [Clostridia bacterium]|nr:hypothetical protein [Clostridia bacterium]
MGVFNSKNWNSEVFGKYLETVPRVKQNALLRAGVLRERPEIRSMLTEQTGGSYVTVPMAGHIGGDALNYDGNTDITATGLDTYLQSMIVVGRSKAWKEMDFSRDITGKDFMETIAAQVGDYWDDVDQATILSILKGIFGVSANNFRAQHTLDITGSSSASVGADTLNTAIQQAAGANKDIFTAVIMHSVVATHLENLQLLTYWKETDSQGVERPLKIASWNGRTVFVDDDVPAEETVATPGVWNFAVSTPAAAGDKITVFGTEYTFVANDAESPAADQIRVGASGTAAQQAANIASKLSALTSGPAANYTIEVTGSTKVQFTQKSTAYGWGAPAVSAEKAAGGSIALGSVTETVAPVEYITYTTYVLGQGAFDTCDCGAATPNEIWRDPKTKGGEDWLITRQRKLFAPMGFSFVQPSAAIVSPTAAQLETAARWAPVTASDGITCYDTKTIPFARILSRG